MGYDNRFNAPSAHGTAALPLDTNADMLIIPEVMKLYERIANPTLTIKRVTITCNNVMPEEYHQYSFFIDAEELARNRKIQKAVLEIKNKFGKDAILKGMNLEEHGTTRERNHQIGGHRSGN